MPTWGDFFQGFNWTGLLTTLFTALAALVCITLHELAHGFAAYCLGDPTAKRAGRLTLNPLKHLDIFGLLMMLSVHVGWAKPVPINTRFFKRPRLGLAVTALAGPAANFLIAVVALLTGRLLLGHGPDRVWAAYAVLALMYIAVLSVGLGVFNLIPISPLDGSKILLSFLPERLGNAVLRKERYIGILMLVLVWVGVLDGPLAILREHAMAFLCRLTDFPFGLVANLFL